MMVDMIRKVCDIADLPVRFSGSDAIIETRNTVWRFDYTVRPTKVKSYEHSEATPEAEKLVQSPAEAIVYIIQSRNKEATSH
ncbi:MAG: hypothetical protein ACLTWR_01800 [Agathobaculum desmolans]|uniref:hypothetical protein n=1 Tax=Agathobaculum desmolans TaxID=39484 RepID=UPI00399691B3